MLSLKLERPLVVFDIESTGLSPRKDRIVELAAIKVMPDGTEISKCWLMNPEVKIPAETTAIHGISNELVKDCPTFKDNAEEIFESTKSDSERTERALSEFLRPEFINRVDEVITFRSLDKEDFCKIAEIMLGQLRDTLKEKGISLSYTAEAVRLIAESSFSEKYGARNMHRYIQKNVEDKLAERLIADYTHSYTQALISVSEGEIAVNCM